MRRKTCAFCLTLPVVPPRRSYCCPEHSRLAHLEKSRLWKRAQRALWRAQGQKYWNDGWRSDEERRGYFLAKMRERRLKNRAVSPKRKPR